MLPALGILLISALSEELTAYPVAQLLLALALLPFYVIFATACHRVVLLGENSIPNRWGMFWTERETRFLGWLVGILFLYFALSLPTGLILSLFSEVVAGWNTAWVATSISYVVVAYFEGRFSLVLPATAIDKRSDFKKSWAMSRGKGMLIAIALVIPALITVPLEIVLYDKMGRELSPLADLIWLVLVLPIVAIEIAIISLAYNKLTSQDER